MKFTKVGSHSICVSVISLSSDRITSTVTSREKSWSVVSNERKQEHDRRTSNPAKLSRGPSQGQHTRTNHSSNDVSTCCPNSSWSIKQHKQSLPISHELKAKAFPLTDGELKNLPVRLRRPSSSKHLEPLCGSTSTETSKAWCWGSTVPIFLIMKDTKLAESSNLFLWSLKVFGQ